MTFFDTEYLLFNFYFLLQDQPGGETTDLCRKFTIIQSGLKAKDCHPEEGIYGVINEEIWRSYVNEKGQIEEPYALRKVKFCNNFFSSIIARWNWMVKLYTVVTYVSALHEVL